jgi:hypothetical protein
LIREADSSAKRIGALITTPIPSDWPSLERSIRVPGEPARDRRDLVTLSLERGRNVLPAPLIGGIGEKEHQAWDLERRADPELPTIADEHADT